MRDSPPSSSTSGGSAAHNTPFGFRQVALGEKQHLVDDVFHGVARRYDLMNDVMSGGLHRLWKDAMVSWLAPPRRGDYAVVDVAGGTGDIAFRIKRRSGGNAQVTVADINGSMLAIGRERAENAEMSGIEFVEANAEALPFADAGFDAYAIAFGIRNVPRIEKALSEAFRVLKHGGRFLCLEFSQVDVPMLDKVYEAYSFAAIPALGAAIAGDREAYQYLVESIRTFPNQARFSAMIGRAGFVRVRHRNFSGGIAALHSAWKV
ncbi:MAG TPA: bifunctional demethylmenaquinone methyltransferase/2-methoxy-6-polyprenyl-1,4-benzoquinol methylase UbiE [Afifellaceae bacterium]|nr:bifunctional demethylmenaquinone methyltransferase/2-methoxy-6-polyprenyl-1,4-benzoquinol methylase UbiE [Afifellaceae bacterium]